MFGCGVRRVVDLQRMARLRSAEEHHFEAADRRSYKVVALEGTQLIGTMLMGADCREDYGDAVVAIRRACELAGKFVRSRPRR